MIREITKNDLKIIADLENIFNNTFKKDDVKNRFSVNIFTKVFIYLQEKYIIGYVIYDEIYDRIEIINIEVLEQYWGNHIASKLLEEVIKYANNKKISNLTLEVKESNEVAIYLYEKYGFKSVAIRENYYNGEHGILMEKK
jgi:ribosomal-protein-alanine acetyltransferase